jgi:hypothetical protein
MVSKSKTTQYLLTTHGFNLFKELLKICNVFKLSTYWRTSGKSSNSLFPRFNTSSCREKIAWKSKQLKSKTIPRRLNYIPMHYMARPGVIIAPIDECSQLTICPMCFFQTKQWAISNLVLVPTPTLS